jgi:hypothetical protein
MENMIVMAVSVGAGVHETAEGYDSVIVFTEKQLNDFINIVIKDYTHHATTAPIYRANPNYTIGEG